MNILLYDTETIKIGQLKHLMDTIGATSGSNDWIALPKGIDVIQDAPIEFLIHYKGLIDEQIKKYKEVENERP